MSSPSNNQSKANSPLGQIQAHMPMEKISTPHGFRKLGIRETLAWNQYIRGRGRWREADLRILYFIVKTDTLIYKAYADGDQDLIDQLHMRTGRLWRDIGFQISTAEGNKLNRKSKVATADPLPVRKLVSI